MPGIGVGPEFGHAPEHREVASRAPDCSQRSQGGLHRIRVRVVTVVEKAEAARFPSFEPAAVQRADSSPALISDRCEAEGKPTRGGQHGIVDHVASRARAR